MTMVNNLSKICRVCMEDGVYDILTSIFDDDYSVHISEKIMACAQVKVIKGDGLPTLICNKCADKVNIAYQFKQQCEYSDLLLRELVQNNNKEISDNDIEELNINPSMGYIMKKDPLNSDHSGNIYKMEPLISENLGAEMEVGQSENDLKHSNTILGNSPPISHASYEINISGNVFYESTDSPYEYFNENCLSPERTLDQFTDIDLNFESKSDQILKRRTRRLPKKLTDIDTYVSPIRKKNVKIKCRVCAVTMSSSAMITHMQKVHNEQAIFCKICNKQFSEKTGLAGHMKSHAKTKLTCNICEATFFSNLKLYLHMQKIHHNSSGLENLEQDILDLKTKKTRPKKYICKCGHAVATPAKLTAHMRTHKKSQNKSNNSSDNTANFDSPVNDLENDEKKYHCTRCSKSFHEKGSLASHEKTHDGLKEHVCKTCGRGFTHCSALRTHQRIHNGELPYVCNYCQRRFRSSGDMNEHIRRAHTFERPFSCSYCDMKFVSSSDLARHTRRHKFNIFKNQTKTNNLDNEIALELDYS
ncbi:zinc finger protein 567-like [Ctenocephalides felis]|uniref:zinc finger protein 567-like n=1 Tax=Ctenocephalides felis TaxID=7515 RepID=UPI000E6E4474|nr:zinc finger protein 567-like [Ctenocephalides felis]